MSKTKWMKTDKARLWSQSMKVFNDNSLVNLSNSILKHFGVTPFYDGIPEVERRLAGHKKVVAVLFDGMGRNIVSKHLKEDSFLRKHYALTINSTYPPTTAAATTSFLTGKYPIETGWLSWDLYFEDYDKNIILFQSVDYNTDEKLIGPGEEGIAFKRFPTTTIFELIEQNNPNVSAACLQRFPIQNDGPKNLRFDGLRKLNKFLKDKEECFAYFYWDSPDREMHHYGIDHRKVHTQVRRAERFVKKAAKKNPDTVFIIFADHGHINVKYFDICGHDDLYSLLSKRMTMEKRTPGFYVKNGKEKEFEELFQKYYGEYFELLCKEDVLKTELFGKGKPAPGVTGMFGDYIAIAKKEYGMYASKEMRHAGLHKGHHAGGTAEERLIDVSIING